MYSEALPVFAPVFICVAIGLLWARSGQEFHSEFLGRVVIWIGAPSLIIGTLGSADIDPLQFRKIAEAAVLMLLIASLLAVLFCGVFRLPLQVFSVPLVFGNSGNMGLPLCLFAFGTEGLALSLGVFVISAFMHFVLGVAVLSGRAPGKELFRSPIVLSALFALFLVTTGWTLPTALSNTFSLLGGMAIPLMLLTLGISLSMFRIKDLGLSLGLGIARLIIWRS